ncbi:uncharacterized protein DNG_07277 [Cephalotrichum gorgonifer]|uniref:Uncharacterized protein n=1 Tax=Cephalotrichum gorgonifer TaxID=2041049 RepID=A0AAE8SY21_9PEZI|nr:uncharacterized protein DNG_07277 [Cephalotrichum gorgonifer]
MKSPAEEPEPPTELGARSAETRSLILEVRKLGESLDHMRNAYDVRDDDLSDIGFVDSAPYGDMMCEIWNLRKTEYASTSDFVARFHLLRRRIATIEPLSDFALACCLIHGLRSHDDSLRDRLFQEEGRPTLALVLSRLAKIEAHEYCKYRHPGAIRWRLFPKESPKGWTEERRDKIRVISQAFLATRKGENALRRAVANGDVPKSEWPDEEVSSFPALLVL